MEDSLDNTIRLVRESVQKFEELSKRQKTKTKVDITEAGQFLILIEDENTLAVIMHGWKDRKRTFRSPGTIDVILSDKRRKESFVIYMTECVLVDFPGLLDNAYNLTLQFLNGQYTVERRRKLRLLQHESIYFPSLKNGEVYKYASKTKRYVNLDALGLPEV